MVTKLQTEHYRDALLLSAYAFQYRLTEEEIEKRLERIKDQDMFGVFAGEQLAAKLVIRHFQIWLNGQQVKMGGIAGVATYPEFRRNGFVKELITHSLSEMRKNGQTVSILHPFSIPFYRKFGWEVLSNYNKVYLTKADLISGGAVGGCVSRFDKISYNPDVEAVYERYARKFSGMLVRQRDQWIENVIRDSFGAIYYNNDSQPLGYLLYQISDSKMKISEFVPINHEARVGLWNYICQHDSMAKDIELHIHERDPLVFTLANPGVKTERVTYGMARVVDVEQLLKLYPFRWKSGDSLTFRVVDEFASWNTGSFTVGPGERRPESGLSLSINTLAALLFGYRSARELAEIGSIQGSEEDIERLECAVSGNSPSLFDFF